MFVQLIQLMKNKKNNWLKRAMKTTQLKANKIKYKIGTLMLFLFFLSTFGVDFVIGASNNFPTSLNNWGSGDVIEQEWANSLEDKIGVDSSTVATSHDFRISTLEASGGSGTVTSVAQTVPTGLTITGSPITGAGTLVIALDTGYVIPLQTTLDAKLLASLWYATTTDGLAEGSTNNYYSTLLFATDLAGTTTTALSEGINLYYTSDRVAGIIAGTTTDALSEGSTNLYYTDARVRAIADFEIDANGFLTPTTTITTLLDGLIAQASSTFSNSLFMNEGTSTGSFSIGGFLNLPEASHPPDVADTLRVHSTDTNGLTRLMVHDSSGFDALIGENMWDVFRNTSGGTISAGTPVYVTGSTGQVANIAPAQADVFSTAVVVGLTHASIDNNNFGFVVTLGEKGSLDTSDFSEGDIVYLASTTAGAITNIEPVYPNESVELGLVMKSNISTGIISIKIEGRDHKHNTLGGVLFINSDGRSAEDPDFVFTTSNNRLTVPDAVFTNSTTTNATTTDLYVSNVLNVDGLSTLAGFLSTASSTQIGVLTITGGDTFVKDGFGLIIGHTAQIDFGATPEFQVLGTEVTDSSLGFAIFNDGASNAPDFRFLKSRGTTIGSNVLVVEGDRLGRIRFQGADGGDFNTTAAEFQVEVDAPTSANNIYGRFVWRTRSSGGLNEKMRLTMEGNLGIGTTTPQSLLTVDGSFAVGTNGVEFTIDSSGNITSGFVSQASSTIDGTLTVTGTVTLDTVLAINQTALVAGTNITLSTNTLNVDDASIVNDANDTMAGVLTADGLTLGANENITLGAQTLDHNGTDFVFSDQVNMVGFLSTASSTVVGNFTIGNTGLLIVEGTATSTIAGDLDITDDLDVGDGFYMGTGVRRNDSGTTTEENTNGFDFGDGTNGMRILPGATTTLEFY